MTRAAGPGIKHFSQLRTPHIYKFNANNAPAPWLFRPVQSVLNGARGNGSSRGEQPPHFIRR